MMEAKQIEIVIDMKEGDPLGATPNDHLTIVRVQKNTIADGKLFVGDKVVKVNETAVKDVNQFFKLLSHVHQQARVLIIRDEKKVDELRNRIHIPKDREVFIQKREGYSYEFVRLDLDKTSGKKLGIFIKHFQNRVLIHRIEPNTQAEGKFQVGDHIIDIDSTPVTDKDVCRRLIIERIKANNFFTCVIERPDSVEAKMWVQNALSSSTEMPPSVQLNQDVLDIMKRQREYMKTKPQPKKPILQAAPRKMPKGIVIKEAPSQYDIGYDNVGRQLRKVKK